MVANMTPIIGVMPSGPRESLTSAPLMDKLRAMPHSKLVQLQTHSVRLSATRGPLEVWKGNPHGEPRK